MDRVAGPCPFAALTRHVITAHPCDVRNAGVSLKCGANRVHVTDVS